MIKMGSGLWLGSSTFLYTTCILYTCSQLVTLSHATSPAVKLPNPTDPVYSGLAASSNPSEKANNDNLECLQPDPTSVKSNSEGAKELQGSLDRCLSQARLLRRNTIFTQKLMQSLLNGVTDEIEEYTVQIHLDADDIHMLGKSVDSEKHLADALEIILESIQELKPVNSYLFEDGVLTWLADYARPIATACHILVIILCVLIILNILRYLWLALGTRKFCYFMFLLSLLVSVPWTWVHLYKQTLAQRMMREERGNLEKGCSPDSLSLLNLVFSNYDKKCEQYYKDQLIDPLWEVKPTTAIAVTFVEFFWTPLEIMGEPLGKFIGGVMEPFPWYVQPVAAILGLIFLGFFMAIASGMKVWTWFFSLEPAATVDYQLDAINQTVENMQALVEDVRSRDTRRNDEFHEFMDKVDRQVSYQDSLKEMLPALERFCSDYIHKEIQLAPESPNAADSAPLAARSESARSAAFMIERPDHYVLTTSDSEKVIKFYSTILGMELRTFKGTRKALHFSGYKINIHVKGKEIQPCARVPTPGSIDICLVCSCSIDNTVNHLQSKGVEMEIGPCVRTGARGPITSVYIRDPDGNLIELAHYDNQHVETIANCAAGDAT